MQVRTLQERRLTPMPRTCPSPPADQDRSADIPCYRRTVRSYLSSRGPLYWNRIQHEASGTDNKKDVDQQISAQYLILEHADQNAE